MRLIKVKKKLKVEVELISGVIEVFLLTELYSPLLAYYCNFAQPYKLVANFPYSLSAF